MPDTHDHCDVAKDLWGGPRYNAKAGLSSFSIHLGAVALMLSLAGGDAVQLAAVQTVSLVAPDISAYIRPVSKRESKGGGGDRSPLPPGKGRAPRAASRQFTPPAAVVRNLNPKLAMPPTVVAPPTANLFNPSVLQFGDPLAKIGPPSGGAGAGGGIGSSSGGGGFGAGVYKVGGGVTSPVLIHQVEPLYTEEARQAKIQGVLTMYIEVDQQGVPRNFRVIRPLGLGLDEKAIEAVQLWRFRPGLKDGRPVAVAAVVEVEFRLL